MSGVERLASMGSGPARLRARLRRETRVIAVFAADQRAVVRIGRRVPESLLGGAIADVMGESLRRALRFWEHQPDAVTGVAPRPVSSLAPRPGNGARRSRLDTWSDVRRGTVAPSTVRRTAAHIDHEQVALPTQEVVDRVARAFEESGERAKQRMRLPPGDERNAHPAEAASPGEGRGHATRVSVVTAARESPLSRALRSYWRGSTVGAPAGSAAVASAPATQLTIRRDASDDGRAVARGDAALPLPPTAREPVHTEGSSPVPAPRARPGGAFPERSVGIRSPRLDMLVADRAAATDWLTGDLADQLADVLREQAIREGIDLT